MIGMMCKKATILAVNLRGPAARQLWKAVCLCTSELSRAQLRARTRHKEETLPELSEDIDRLSCLAYPETTAAMLQVLTRDQYVDSLSDEKCT